MSKVAALKWVWGGYLYWIDCNESLDSGDIIGGNGELNWIFIVDVWICWNSAKETKYYKIIHKWRRDYIGDA